MPSRGPAWSLEDVQVVLQGVQDGITVQDPTGALVYANAAAARLLGFRDPEELLQAPAGDVLARFACYTESGEPLAVADLPGRRALRAEPAPVLTVRFRVKATGEERWSRVAATPVLDDAGAVRAVVNVFHDLTDAKRAELAARFLADASAVLAASLEPETTMRTLARLVVDQGLADMCSVYDRSEGDALRYLATAHRDPAVEGRTARVIAEEGIPRRVVEVARTGRILVIGDAGDDVVRETRDPAHRAFRASLDMRSSILVPLLARGRVVGVMTLSTLHGGRRLQERDAELAGDLAARAGLAVDNARLYTQAEAGRAVAEEANARLRELDRMKTQFINTVSHELRTPLTPLALQVQLLRSRGVDPALERTVTILERNIRRLSELVADLGDVARLQSGKLTVRPQDMDLAAVVREAVESFDEPARRAGIALRLHAPAALLAHADPRRVAQVVFNLVTNAVKFTPPGGTITVALRSSADAAEVRVQDTGAGLTPEQRALLFQPFSQVHEESRAARGGTGLGLYICKGLVEQQGGAVGVESAGPGKGSAFWFTVPLRPPPSDPPPSEQAPARKPADE